MSSVGFVDDDVMQRAREASRPCADCGLLTGCFCDFCYIGERYPCPEEDRWRHTPLCTRCNRQHDDACHYCRRVQWCTPPTWEKTGTYQPDPQPAAQKTENATVNAIVPVTDWYGPHMTEDAFDFAERQVLSPTLLIGGGATETSVCDNNPHRLMAKRYKELEQVANLQQAQDTPGGGKDGNAAGY